MARARAWGLAVLGVLSLCLWGPSVTSEAFCGAPGRLPAPEVFLSKSPAAQGVSAVVRCLVPYDSLANRVIFCKAEEELSSQKATRGKFTYELAWEVSVQEAGQISCGYQRKDDHNRVTNSFLSLPWDRRKPDSNVTSEGSGRSPGWRLNSGLGMTIPVFLLLVLVLTGYLPL